MIIDKQYRFKVSLSQEYFKDKNTCIDFLNNDYRKHDSKRGISYKKTELTSSELCDKLIHGHVFCQCMEPQDELKRNKFGVYSQKAFRTDGTFGTGQKTNNHFKAAYLMCVDIDDENDYDHIQDYISKLRLKPTFYYTTYSHNQPGKGLRFRIVYVLDKPITGSYLYYRYCNYKLNCLIEKDTNTIIKDTCNLEAAQYFNGTYIENPEYNVEYEINHIIYSLSDFGIYSDKSDDYADFLKNNAGYEGTLSKNNRLEIESELFRIKPEQKIEKQEQEDLDIFSESFAVKELIKEKFISKNFIQDLTNMSSEDFYKKYHYIITYRVTSENWYDLKIGDINYKWQNIPDNYFELYYNVENYKKVNGQARRRELAFRMALRRIIKPSITPEELLYNAYFDLNRFIDNTDVKDKITMDDLITRVYNVMEKDIQDLKDNPKIKETIKELQNENTPKFEYGIIFCSGIKNYKTAIHYWLIDQIDKLYDKNKSVKENLNFINQVFKNENRKTISKDILYNYIKELKQDKIELKGKELKSQIDFSKGIKWNLNQLRSKGYKVNQNEVTELINKRKKQREYRNKKKETKKKN